MISPKNPDIKNQKLVTSELRYRRLFETAQSGILLVDFHTGIILDVNQFLIDLLNYSKEDFLEKHLWEIGAFKDIAASQENFSILQREKYIRFENLPLETKTGKKIDVEFIANVYEVDGAITIQCDIRDITSQKLMREDLENANIAVRNVLEDLSIEKSKAEDLAKDLEKFKLAVDNVSDQIIITDANGIVIYCNPAIEKTTGYAVEDVLGKKSGVLWKAPMPQEYYQIFWDTIKVQKRAFIGEIQNKRKSGEIYTAVISVSPILDKNGEIIYFVGIERDITKEKEIDRAKTEFISIASHQLRTPVSAIRWLIESVQHSLGKAHLTDKQTVYIHDMYTMAERLSRLVEDLLNISRMEMGTYKVQVDEFKLNSFIQGTIKELRVYAAENEHNIEYKAPQESLKVSVAGNLVNTVLSNLATNAVDYSPRGTKVDISLEKEGQFAKISVSNTGPGIPPEEQDELFARFYRGKRGRETNPEGSGLGLYIVKMFVEKMGGKVGLSSDDNATTFWFTLPLV